ncbi:LysR substrate-binding domain-containing protein [Novosphingobium sp. THN1]|uniref:LysR substrate-binding domain-containing protein n=1 Tax=Novosphingobium sp. THN1 TaxID=1016987 RepID=UPI001F078B33|nr:LysR substrate-binding domain-containing protein [Novosphingobium sp. THN1]
MELTPVGREIAERARRVLREIRDIRAVAARARKQLSGVVRLGITPTLGPYLLPALIGALNAEQSDMRFYIREGIPAEQSRELVSGRIDLMVGPGPVIGEDLEVVPLFDEPMSVVASRSHHLAGLAHIDRSDLKGERFLTLDPRHHYHQQVQRVCAELGAEMLLDYEGTSLDSIHQMVGSGVGLAILPELYLRSEVGAMLWSCGCRLRTGAASAPSLLPGGPSRQARMITARWRSASAARPPGCLPDPRSGGPAAL